MEGRGGREAYLDAAKGMGILGVVASHCLAQTNLGAISDWYVFFMLAVFYVYTGWRYQLKYEGKPTGISAKEMCRRRLASLGVPYVCYSILLILCRTILVWPEKYTALVLLSDIYYTGTLVGLETLWFLPSIFITELLLNQVYGRRKAMLAGAGAAGIISVLLILYINARRENTTLWRVVHLPVMVYIKAMAGFLLAAGGVAACRGWKRFVNYSGQRVSFGVALALTAAGILAAWIVPGCDFNYLTMANPVQWILTALFIASSILAFWERAYAFQGSWKDVLLLKGVLIPALTYCGRHSLTIMCTHLVPVIALLKFLAGKAGYPGLLLKAPWDMGLFVVVMVIEAGMVWLIEKHLHWMNGVTLKSARRDER